MLDKTNGIISGNDCMVWLNGEVLDDIKSFEYKITFDYADVNYLGDPRTYRKALGWSGSGTLTFNKSKSRGATLLKDQLKTSVTPDVKIVTKMVNASTGKAERAVISGITFDEFGASSEGKSVGEESLPFNFNEIDFPELM